MVDNSTMRPNKEQGNVLLVQTRKTWMKLHLDVLDLIRKLEYLTRA